MPELTIVEFKEIVHSAVGPEEASAVGSDNLDTSLTDLGIDSLGVLEIVHQICERYSVEISDASVTGNSTPQAVIELVQSLLR